MGNARELILSDAIKEAKEDGEIIQRLFGKFKKAWSKIGFEAIGLVDSSLKTVILSFEHFDMGVSD